MRPSGFADRHLAEVQGEGQPGEGQQDGAQAQRRQDGQPGHGPGPGPGFQGLGIAAGPGQHPRLQDLRRVAAGQGLAHLQQGGRPGRGPRAPVGPGPGLAEGLAGAPGSGLDERAGPDQVAPFGGVHRQDRLVPSVEGGVGRLRPAPGFQGRQGTALGRALQHVLDPALDARPVRGGTRPRRAEPVHVADQEQDRQEQGGDERVGPRAVGVPGLGWVLRHDPG